MNLQCEVHSQKAGLVVDTRQRTIRGWTELQLTPGKDSHKLGLHALGLSIHSVTVNGRQAEFKHKPHQTWEELPDSVLTAQHASPDKMLAAVGEAAYYQYERALQREKELELVITHAGDESSPLTPSQRPAPELDPAPGNPTLIEGGEPPAAPAAPDSLPFPTPPANPAGGTIAVRVEYSAVRPACGVHFSGRYAATCNQVRRASAWLPCLDVPNGKVEFSLQLTVREDEVAVASGNLLKRTASHQLPGWHTYHYSTPLPCPPCQLMFAVGPFAVLPSPPSAGRPSSALITHFCPPADVHPPSIPPSPLVSGDLDLPGATPSGGPPASGGGKGGDRDPPLLATAKFFLLPMSLYETLLGQRFPLPSMQQVFVPGDVLPEGVQVGVGVQVLPSHLLLNLRSIEQSLEARLVIAGALARQWFGVYMRPATPADDWLVEGLAGWLEEQYIKKYMGNNELQYRRWRQREAIVAADTGDAPPLSWRGPSTPSPWGALYGTHALDPSNLRKLKATAVIGMLERRAGDMFKKHLERVLSAACHPEPSASGNPRLLDTTAFLTDLGKAASFRKEIPAFAERWIYRRGVPSITAGFLYHRRKSVLELAIRQSGSEAAKEAADVAERVAQREGTGAGVIKVVVRESEVTTEHPVHLGGHAAVLQELKVNPEVKKPAGRRGMRKKKGEGEEGDVADGDALLGEAGPASAALVDQHPVQWVRIDPGGEWLCSCRMVQPERCWLAQLQHSKDVVAQAEAVQGLVDLSQGSSGARPSVLAALVRVLDSSTVYFRVRQDAALALAALRDGEGGCAGLEPLLSWYKSRHWDTAADPPCPRPTPVTDPSEYLVAQAVVAAIACCKDGDGLTHMDALLFLMEELDSYQSRVGGYDDSGLVAAMCEALGTITTDPELAESYLTMLEGELMRDVVAPSPSSCVGRACLGAMVQLATGASGSAELRASASDTLRRCLATASLPAPLRREAHAAAVQLLSAAGGAEAALRYAVHAAGAHALVAARAAKGAEGEAVATARLESAGAGELFFPLMRARSGLSEGLDPATVAGIWEEVVGVAGGNHGILSLATLRRTAALLNAAHHCRLRHLAFMALRRLQRLPPTLYQPPSPDDEDFLTGGAVPAISHGATRRTGAVPAPSGAAPAPTHDSKGAATTRTKRVTIRLPIKAGGGRGALSGEDGGGVEESAGGVTMSDGRVAGAMASPSVSEVAQPLPLEAMGTQFSPVRPPDDVAGGEEEEVGTQLKPPAPAAPLQTGAHPALRPAGTAAEAPAVSPGPPSGPIRSLKLKIRAPSSGPPAPAAAPAAPAGSAEVAVPRQQGGMVGGSTPPIREASPGLTPGKPHAGGGSLGQGPGRKLPGSRKTSPAPPPGAARERSREPSPLAVPSAGKGGRASREPSPVPRPPSLPGAAQQRKQQGASPGISGDQGAVGGVGPPGKRTPSRQATPTGVEEYPKPGGRGGATRPKQAKREKTPQPAADEGPKPELGDVLAAFMQAGEAAEPGRSKGGKKRRPPSASPEQPGSGSATTAGAAGGQRCGKRPRATPPPSASPPPPAAPSRPPSAGGGTAPGEPVQRKASLIASTMPRVVIKGKKQMQQQPSWAQRAVAQEPSEPRGGQPANQTAHPPQHAQGGPPQVPSSGAAGAGFGGGSAAASQQTQPAAPGAAKPAFKIKLKVKPLAKPP